MGLLRRRGKEPEVPAWANFFSAEQYASFMATVDAELDARGVRRATGDGFVQLREEQDERVLGLSNLAQTCLGLAPGAWEEAVASHFGKLLDTPSEPPHLSAAEALPLLRIRLWARDDIPAETAVLSRPVADDLLAVIVLDLPDSIVNVRPQDAGEWGAPTPSLWERARANTQADADLERSPLVLPGEVEVTFGLSHGLFAASAALWPDLLVGPLGPAGALVAVPNRHTVAVHPIVHLGVLEGMRHLVPLIARQHKEGPGSLSDQLYWSTGGELTRIPASMDGDWVTVTPPAEFVAAVNLLPRPDASPDPG